MAKQTTTSPGKRSDPTSSHSARDPKSRERSRSRARAQSRGRVTAAVLKPRGTSGARGTTRGDRSHSRSTSASPRKARLAINLDSDTPPLPPLRGVDPVQILGRARSPAKQIGVTKRSSSCSRSVSSPDKGGAGRSGSVATGGTVPASVRKSSRLMEKAASTAQGRPGGRSLVGKVQDAITG